MTESRTRFEEFKARDTVADSDLDEFWASLEPATVAEMLGDWCGGEFVTGHRANGRLDKAHWYGKTFNSVTDAKPLICLDEQGQKYSNTELMKGEASLWLEEFRGEMVATMVYDGVPIHDHFKRVDDNAVMGIMNGKGALDTSDGRGRYLYFYLERD